MTGRTLSLAIFAFAYLLIAARRLSWLPIGRPTGALLGAVLMVLLGCLTPEQAYSWVDGNTIALLFGMMVLQVELDRSGLLDTMARSIARRRVSASTLLATVVFAAGILSALLVNDAVCVMATPLVARLCRTSRLPPLPFLLALATGSNVGGTMTLTGTPQCMLVGRFSGLSFSRYASVMAPTGLLLLAVTAAFFVVVFRRTLAGARTSEDGGGDGRAPAAAEHPRLRDATLADSPPVLRAPETIALDRPRARRFVLCLFFVVVGFFAGLPLAWVALAGACLVALMKRSEPTENLARLDWPLLVFFASLFVVVGGLAQAGWIDDAVRALEPTLSASPDRRPVAFAGFSLVASNVFSNVPFVLVLGHGYPEASQAFWYQLALTSTLAGNLTLVGSVANLIVAEAAAKEGVHVGFADYAKIGIPLTLLTTAAGLGALAVLGYA